MSCERFREKQAKEYCGKIVEGYFPTKLGMFVEYFIVSDNVAVSLHVVALISAIQMAIMCSFVFQRLCKNE